jgi:urea transport system permease protein
MVVVLGGVGQLAGTVYAALGLGILNKFLEGWTGAVLAKIAVLVFIIIFHPETTPGNLRHEGKETCTPRSMRVAAFPLAGGNTKPG